MILKQLKQNGQILTLREITSIADVLSKHFKIVSSDLIAPVIEGNDAAVMVGVKATVSEILDLFIKDDQDGVIDIAKADIYN